VYGFNWTLRQWPGTAAEKAGWWRLTFALDPVSRYTIVEEEGSPAQAFAVARNVSIAALDPGDLGAEVVYRPTILLSPMGYPMPGRSPSASIPTTSTRRPTRTMTA
jgi:hypothetical protein